MFIPGSLSSNVLCSFFATMNIVVTRGSTEHFAVGPTEAVQIAGNDSNRNSLVIHNEAGVLYVALGTHVSNSDYAYRLVGNMTVEIEHYIGPVTAIKQSGQTSVFVTSLL